MPSACMLSFLFGLLFCLMFDPLPCIISCLTIYFVSYIISLFVLSPTFQDLVSHLYLDICLFLQLSFALFLIFFNILGFPSHVLSTVEAYIEFDRVHELHASLIESSSSSVIRLCTTNPSPYRQSSSDYHQHKDESLIDDQQ